MHPRRLPLARPALGLTLLAATSCIAVDPHDRTFGQLAPGELSFEVVEVGPLEVGQAQRLALAGTVPSVRVESYGGTSLELALHGLDGADPYLVVEGPLPGDGDDSAPATGPVVAEDDDSDTEHEGDARLHVVLTAPGVYRVIAGTYGSLALGEAPEPGALVLESRCDAACTRPALSQQEFLGELRASGRLEPFAAKLRAQLAARVPDPVLQAALGAQLDAILASPDFAGVERFPTIPLRGVSAARPALGGLEAKPPSPDATVTGDLEELLAPCDATRPLPPPASPDLPGVGNGHFPNRALTRCQVSQSEKLAQILTSLSVGGDASMVRYRGRELRSPAALVRALLETGHTVEMRNERTYANFISLTLGDRDVRWPVWLDTGVQLAGGAPLTVPVGHSHHAFRIAGPVVNARVMFYLGISGAAFFAQTSSRPAWTGEVARDVTESTADGVPIILSALDAAAKYLRRNRVERTTVAAGLPADGYGYVGVCNDSNATVEYATRGTITAFPLLRAASLDEAPALGDGLDDAVRALPHDADVAPPRRDALQRVLAMTPLPLDSPLVLDEALRGQLQAAQGELATAGN